MLSWLIDWFDLFRVCPSRLCGSFETYSYPTYARLYKSHRTTHMQISLVPYSALQTSKWSYWSCGTCRPLEVRRYVFPGYNNVTYSWWLRLENIPCFSLLSIILPLLLERGIRLRHSDPEWGIIQARSIWRFAQGNVSQIRADQKFGCFVPARCFTVWCAVWD